MSNIEKRTKYTNSLITDECAGEIYRKEKIGEMVNFDSLRKCYKKPYEDDCAKLGAIMAQICVLTEEYNRLQKNLVRQKKLVDILEQTNAENYGDFVDEEKYMTLPDVEDFNPSIITKNMVIVYIEKVYGLNKALLIDSILEDKK